MFDGFLDTDIIKISLAFYNTVRMFDYGLPSSKHFLIVFDSNFVLTNQMGVLGVFNKSAFDIFSAFCKKFAI